MAIIYKSRKNFEDPVYSLYFSLLELVEKITRKKTNKSIVKKPICKIFFILG